MFRRGSARAHRPVTLSDQDHAQGRQPPVAWIRHLGCDSVFFLRPCIDYGPMSISRLFSFTVASFCMLASASGEPSDGYVNPALCSGCHSEIAPNYRSTGMARSFYRPLPENTV